MATQKEVSVVGSLADLPDHANGARHLVWWGNLGFMLIEGTGFALAIAAYLYVLSHSSAWPPAGDALPDLGWSGVFTLGLLLSEIPNLWLLRQARAKKEQAVRIGILLMTVIGVGLTVIRLLEFGHLNVRWSADGYGSMVWLLMVLHTTHVFTELGETAVQALWLFTHEVGDNQFSDVEDTANYWTFVVLFWLPIYGLVYWMPRLS
ncbi:cytochrome c oxidase subunit 3 [Mesorhizobium sp. RP14(2022)]|uniref:Cytochrome c oxidase subunit 3 n=1 Tax=Mesorhizobium liriopis TaxID=2953882 RepID=A0ABT1C5V9_9HYPH|nr:cytochrome c oxidase subunit 3 [Mesorhizobium liriopis]MCO6050217.1 cytochrome c oxidase subunit 3 [Mesorhizobium liriopis]